MFIFAVLLLKRNIPTKGPLWEKQEGKYNQEIVSIHFKVMCAFRFFPFLIYI